ncbi:MAG: NrfD/PsrC family molybdoenzyme membrane anchor subunit [Chloroflexota bacterium]
MRHPENWRRGRRRPPTSHGSPPIHKPHWKWLIISYFFLGGLSAGSYVVATAAELFGRQEDRAVTRVGRYLALLALIPCPPLLILDLGRPERFLYMLRVIKLRSPMSIGTWGLLTFSQFTMLSAARQAASDGVTWGPFRVVKRLPSHLIGLFGAVFGFFVGGYTGVLLGATAVPLWARNARLLGPLFLCSALAAACSGISLVLALLPGRRHGSLQRLRRAEIVAATGELLAMIAMHFWSGHLGAPLTSGRLGRLHLGGSLWLGIVTPVLLHVVGNRLRLPHRLVTILASLASLAGGLTVKYVMVMAGQVSADDPGATFEFAGGSTPEPLTSDGHADRPESRIQAAP